MVLMTQAILEASSTNQGNPDTGMCFSGSPVCQCRSLSLVSESIPSEGGTRPRVPRYQKHGTYDNTLPLIYDMANTLLITKIPFLRSCGLSICRPISSYQDTTRRPVATERPWVRVPKRRKTRRRTFRFESTICDHSKKLPNNI